MGAPEKQTLIAAATAKGGFPLDSVKKGSRLVIIDIPDGKSRTQLIRLGILEGQVIQCIERMPGGTVVIEKNRQEIALGAGLAKTIVVKYAVPESG
jgi:Fe2+ transport system protein FeoA